MTITFREYLKAEILTELFSNVFLGGKHARLTAFLLLIFLGFFLFCKKILGGILGLLGLLLFHRGSRVHKDISMLRSFARKKNDISSKIFSYEDQNGVTWWGCKIHPHLWSSGNWIVFLSDKRNGDIKVFLETINGTESIPIGQHLSYIERQNTSLFSRESLGMVDLYTFLRRDLV